MAALTDILGWRNISTAVQKVETGVPDRLPPAFNTTKENVLGDRTTYVTFYGERRTARRSEYGAPSRARTLRPLGEQSVTLLHFPEHMKLRQELMVRLRNPNDLLAQQMAQTEIARHGADFKQTFDNTRIISQVSMLANGKLWFDAGGNILGTSSGAATIIDYLVPAANLNQLSGMISASWATSSTPIIQNVENVRIQMKKNTGRDLKHAFYGKNIANYLYTNDTLAKYWQFNSTLYGQLQSNPGVIPNGTFGLEWHRMGDTFFASNNDVGSDETLVSMWDGDKITFSPEIDRNSYTLYEGSICVPKKYGISADSAAATGDFELVYGIGGYAVPEVDPVGIKEVYFDTMLPHWKNPLDLFIADVTP